MSTGASKLLKVGETCSWLGPVSRSAVIVDASAYYAALYRAACLARHHIVIAGWQFDTNVKLLRGDAARTAEYPVQFLAFLNALCAARSGLRVFLLAWDYSLIYSLEREWLQKVRFAFQSSPAVRFEFAKHPSFGGSHHQKFVVIDGQVAFVGGLDVCDERWDDREHAASNELRVNTAGEACRPNHEVQSVVQGEVADVLLRMFCERWRDALGESLSLRPEEARELSELDLSLVDPSAILPLRAERVAIARTLPPPSSVREVEQVIRSALLASRRLVYAETQYFTSCSVMGALLERMRDSSKPRLQLLVLLPQGADNSKEKFALGDLQNAVLSDLQKVAQTFGHQVRFLCSGAAGEACNQTTFIHSKVLIVDDELLCVGSANFTERSMTLDSELCLLWHGEAGSDLCRDIAFVRASLLAEHSGQPLDELLEPSGLVEKVEAAIARRSSRLRMVRFEPASTSPLKRAIFDPSVPGAAPNDRRGLG